MDSYREKIKALFEHRERTVPKMDSFQVVKEIEETIINLLYDIFAPYPLKMVERRDFTHIPDGVIKFLPLSKRKNLLFFEIKTRKIETFDLKVIREMLKELNTNYPTQFYSLIIVTKTIDDKLIRRLLKEPYLAKVKIITIEALLEIADKFRSEPELKTPENKESFLLNLLKNKVISPSVVRESSIPPLLKEYSFKKVTSQFITRDNFKVNVSTSFRIYVKNQRRFIDNIISEPLARDNIKTFVLKSIAKNISNIPLLALAFQEEKVYLDIKRDVVHELSRRGIKVIDFELSYCFDQKTKLRIEQSRYLIDESKQILKELRNAEHILSKIYVAWRRNIDYLNGEIDELTERCICGEITEESYKQKLRNILDEILVIKERLTKIKIPDEIDEMSLKKKSVIG